VTDRCVTHFFHVEMHASVNFDGFSSHTGSRF
jgi:hypothetical protein